MKKSLLSDGGAKVGVSAKHQKSDVFIEAALTYAN